MTDPNFDTASHMSVHDKYQDSFEEEDPCEDALEIQKLEDLTMVRTLHHSQRNEHEQFLSFESIPTRAQVGPIDLEDPDPPM